MYSNKIKNNLVRQNCYARRERKVIRMLLKVGINRRGIQGNVDTYVFKETFLFSDIEKIQKKAEKFVSSIPEEYDEIQLYQYDINFISRIEYMEVIKAFICSKKDFKVYQMVYDNESAAYTRQRIK